MDVLVVALDERARTQATQQRLDFFRREHAGVAELLRPGDRALHVFGEELAIEGEGIVQRPQEGGRPFREAAAPHGHSDTALSSTTNGAIRFRPRVCKPKSLMKPAESVTS